MARNCCRRALTVRVGPVFQGHDGAPDRACRWRQLATEPQRMISRHVAVLDTEALYLADKIGTIRNDGGEPSEKTIDLYSRVTSASRRHLETLGLDRMQRDITPSLGAYLEGKAAEGVPGGPERPGRVAVSHPTDSAASQNLASPQILDVNSPEFSK